MKGGWKETRGLQRPISAETPVSESRLASLNPFETKRKKAPSGTLSRVCNVQVAEGADLAANSLPCQRQPLRARANCCAMFKGRQSKLRRRSRDQMSMVVVFQTSCASAMSSPWRFSMDAAFQVGKAASLALMREIDVFCPT